MTIADSAEVAEIHCEALAGDFLPSMGKSFLSTLYRCIINTNAGFGIIYEQDNRVAGVAVATENAGRFFKSLFLKRFWTLMPKMMFSLLRHPSLIKRTFETLLFSKKESGEQNPGAELMVIVLRNYYQHKGIGSELLSYLNREFSRRMVKNYVVRTFSDNKASNSFYTATGFKKHSSFIMYSREWNLYKYDIKEDGK